MNKSAYAAAGVDIEAGDRAVELMKASVARTHRPEVLGGLGGFAGFFDASALKGYAHPVLATSTDGVGTKVAIAQALDRHDTIGSDLVGMLVDDLVVTGAEPLFVTDYIACGKVVPERIAAIVSGIADACVAAGCSLVGGRPPSTRACSAPTNTTSREPPPASSKGTRSWGLTGSRWAMPSWPWHRRVCTPTAIRWCATCSWNRPGGPWNVTSMSWAAPSARSSWNPPRSMPSTSWR